MARHNCQVVDDTIVSLTKSNEDLSTQNMQLKQQLTDSADALKQVQRGLKDGAAVHATIFDVVKNESTVLEDFKKGAIVRFRDGSKDSRTGLVTVPPKDGKVKCKFGDVEEEFDVSELSVAKGKSILLKAKGETLEIQVPDGLDVKPGDVARLNAKTMQFVGLTRATADGPVVLVKTVTDKRVEVEIGGNTQVVKLSPGLKVEPGDRVLLDSSGAVILENYGNDVQPFSNIGKNRITFDSIGGLAEVKAQLIQLADSCFGTSKRKKRTQRPKGALLVGPPGNGKTLLVRAFATYIYERYGAELIYVEGSEAFNKFIGTTEERIRAPYEYLDHRLKRTGKGGVVAWDEAEVTFKLRGSGISQDVSDNAVVAVSTKIDGGEDLPIISLMISNRPDIMDPAVTRAGRLTFKIHVPRPDREAAESVFRIHCADTTLKYGTTVDELWSFVFSEIYSDKYPLSTVSLTNGQHILQFHHAVTGAMIADIVKVADLQVEDRCREADDETIEKEGICKEDLLYAIQKMYQGELTVSHQYAIEELCHETGGELIAEKRLIAVNA